MIAPQIAARAFVFSTTHTDRHLADIAELIAPQVRLALIYDPASLDIVAFVRKAVPGKMSARAGQAKASSPATIAIAWSTKRAFSPTGAT
nr:hypothetical protein [uncultured Sphingomonas sp.]